MMKKTILILLFAINLLVANGKTSTSVQPESTKEKIAKSAIAHPPVDTTILITLEQIEVFSTRADSKTPIAFSEIDFSESSLTETAQDIPFIITLTPSAVATSDSGTGIGYTSIRIRGVDGTRINVTANGVPMNDSDSHNLYWVNIPDIASSLQNIQIQRGVGTSTNGSGAFGGSINLKTESHDKDIYSEADISLGSFNTRKTSLKVNSGLVDDKWIFGMRLSKIDSDGYIERASSDLKSWFAHGGYYNRGTMVKIIAFGGNERTYHAWNGISRDQLSSNRRYNTCGEINEVMRDNNGAPVLDENGDRVYYISGFYENQTDNYAQNNYQLIFNHQISSLWSLNSTLHYTNGRGYYEEYKNSRSLAEYGLMPYTTTEPDKVDYVDAAGNVAKSNLVRRKNMTNDFYGIISSLNYNNKGVTSSIGVAANRYVGEHFGEVVWVKNYIGQISPNHRYYNNDTDKYDANIFARVNWEVVKRLNLYADMQYRRISYKLSGQNDNYDYRSGYMQALDINKTYNFFNPKAGLLYELNSKINMYASLAVANKEPTRNNFTDSKENTTILPERLFDYEAGVTFKDKIIWGGVNLYYMDYKNQLVLTGETNEIGEPLSDNVPHSYRAGIELTAGIKITDWLQWSGNGTFSRNIIKNYTEYVDNFDSDWNPSYTQTAIYLGDTNIAYSPSIVAGSMLTVNFGRLFAAIQTQFVSSQYVTNSMQDGSKGDSAGQSISPLKLDSYCVTNLRVNYDFKIRGLKKLSAGIALNNIFNSKYCSNGWGYSALIHNADDTTSRYNEMGYFPQATINMTGNITLRF